jgi:Holliday junction resolvasome RuvABC ATP-dependent DNA helicase subunit
MVAAHYLAWRMANSTGTPSGPTVKRGDDILDGPYPRSFTEFVGQDIAVQQVMASIASSFHRETRMDHMLFDSGSPGIGKTSLARLAAHRKGAGFVELGGSVRENDAAKALKHMVDGDVLFLDEIHRLVSRGKSGIEWLLTLMEDGTLHLPTGAVKAPDITIIAATTDGQKLPTTVLDRFPIKPVLEDYTDAQALRIAELTAARQGFGDLVPMPESNAWLAQVAAACVNNPRRIRQLLIAVRDSTLASGNLVPGPHGYDIATALVWNGLTRDGLDRLAQGYLVGLLSYGGVTGLSTLKALLQTEHIQHTENDLVQRGFVQVTPKGRALTDYGQERAQSLAEELVAKHIANKEDAA